MLIKLPKKYRIICYSDSSPEVDFNTKEEAAEYLRARVCNICLKGDCGDDHPPQTLDEFLNTPCGCEYGCEEIAI